MEFASDTNGIYEPAQEYTAEEIEKWAREQQIAAETGKVTSLANLSAMMQECVRFLKSKRVVPEAVTEVRSSAVKQEKALNEFENR